MCRIPISFLFVHYFVFPCRHENCHQHVRWRKICWFFDLMMMMMMMMMMMIMNFFCGMADRRKAFRLISSRDHCQRSSHLWISDTLRAGFEPAQNLSSGLVEWSCTVVITATPRRHLFTSHIYLHFYCFILILNSESVFDELSFNKHLLFM